MARGVHLDGLGAAGVHQCAHSGERVRCGLRQRAQRPRAAEEQVGAGGGGT